MTEFGTWIKNEKLYPFHNCSGCNYNTYVQTPYCPNCGRKMEIIEEDVETAKIFRLSCYIVDTGSEICKDDIKVMLKNCFDACILHHINIDDRDIGEWDDDNPLNLIACPVEECEKYFT